jgi:hypothetical protein
MSSETNSTPSEQAELAGHRVWETVENRLWSRARLILAFVVIGIAIVVALGLPLVKSSLERRIMEQARLEMTAILETEKIDVTALRKQLREDTSFVREQLIAEHVSMGSRLGVLLQQAEELEATFTRLRGDSMELQSVKRQMVAIQTNMKNEQERLNKLRTTYERELHTFKDEAERMSKNAPTVIRHELDRVERIVDRELDELRAVIADHTAGRPAMFSTFFNPDGRVGQVTGVNFGEKPGRVFLRVRVFSNDDGEAKAESESIMVQPTLWGDNTIEIRLNARVLEQIDEAEAELIGEGGSTPLIRYGYLVQTAAGLMSKWSGMRADSIIPPERISAASAE